MENKTTPYRYLTMKLLEPTWHIKVSDMGAFRETRHSCYCDWTTATEFSMVFQSASSTDLSVLYSSGITNLICICRILPTYKRHLKTYMFRQS